ncbi:MAG: tetratricopeptide repeat protein [Bacteroidetes bacterium]|jgi:tetratricopeptide (TPR) repeat protein|nr:tetratricopeptide repeat protein [Bacteroidota bacterium]
MATQTLNDQIRQAEEHILAGDYGDALTLLHEVLSEDPTHTEALNDAAIAYKEMGDVLEAVKCLEAVLQQDPTHSNAFFNLLDTLALTDDLELVIDAYLHYEEQIPDTEEKVEYAERITSEAQQNVEEQAAAQEVGATLATWRNNAAQSSLIGQDEPKGALSVEALEMLVQEWDNGAWAATPTYLALLSQLFAHTAGAVVECGSGVSTLVLHKLNQSGERRVISLEHHRGWYEHLQTTLPQDTSVELCHTPLRSYDGFDWYDTASIDLPSNIGLIICDGPPGTTPGGRVGALHVLSEGLRPGTIIVLDDANRSRELAALLDWAGAFDLHVELFTEGKGIALAQIV